MKLQADLKTENVIKDWYSITILIWSLMLIFISTMNLQLGKAKAYNQPSKRLLQI